MRSRTSSLHRRRALAVAVVAIGALALGGCGSDPEPADVDDVDTDGEVAEPVELTWWVRAANEAKSAALAVAYNESHEDQVTVTAFPDDQFVTRVGTAMAGGELPDLLASDAVYMPTYVEQGIYLPLNDYLADFEHADTLFPQLLEVATDSAGSVFAVPRDPGTSLLFWNKDLFEQAGLDPEAPPTTWDEVVEYAAAIDALGGEISGYYMAGNCAGCNAYTYLPMLWASGGDVLTPDGASFDSEVSIQGLEFLNQLWTQGSIPESARSDGGENWFTAFTAGNIGIEPLGSFAIGIVAAENPEMNFGVAPLPGIDGEGAAFIGGDVIGISSQSEHADAAWEFLAWTLSDEVQLEIVAQSGELVSRTDLVDNEYTSANPNAVAGNEALAVGRVPVSKLYQQLIQDPNGPFLLMLQAGVFDGNAAAAAAAAQETAEAIVEANR